MIPSPPQVPQINGIDPQLFYYLQQVNEYLTSLYAILKDFDIGKVKISSGSGAPSGGNDGDLYIRVAGASTQLYLNINGTFSGYNNP